MRHLNLLYGMLACLGLLTLGLPQVKPLLLAGGTAGELIGDIVDVLAAVGFYGLLVFSVLLLFHVIRSFR